MSNSLPDAITSPNLFANLKLNNVELQSKLDFFLKEISPRYSINSNENLISNINHVTDVLFDTTSVQFGQEPLKNLCKDIYLSIELDGIHAIEHVRKLVNNIEKIGVNNAQLILATGQLLATEMGHHDLKKEFAEQLRKISEIEQNTLNTNAFLNTKQTKINFDTISDEYLTQLQDQQINPISTPTEQTFVQKHFSTALRVSLFVVTAIFVVWCGSSLMSSGPGTIPNPNPVPPSPPPPSPKPQPIPKNINDKSTFIPYPTPIPSPTPPPKPILTSSVVYYPYVELPKELTESNSSLHCSTPTLSLTPLPKPILAPFVSYCPHIELPKELTESNSSLRFLADDIIIKRKDSEPKILPQNKFTVINVVTDQKVDDITTSLTENPFHIPLGVQRTTPLLEGYKQKSNLTVRGQQIIDQMTSKISGTQHPTVKLTKKELAALKQQAFNEERKSSISKDNASILLAAIITIGMMYLNTQPKDIKQLNEKGRDSLSRKEKRANISKNKVITDENRTKRIQKLFTSLPTITTALGLGSGALKRFGETLDIHHLAKPASCALPPIIPFIQTLNTVQQIEITSIAVISSATLLGGYSFIKWMRTNKLESAQQIKALYAKLPKTELLQAAMMVFLTSRLNLLQDSYGIAGFDASGHVMTKIGAAYFLDSTHQFLQDSSTTTAQKIAAFIPVAILAGAAIPFIYDTTLCYHRVSETVLGAFFALAVRQAVEVADTKTGFSNKLISWVETKIPSLV